MKRYKPILSEAKDKLSYGTKEFFEAMTMFEKIMKNDDDFHSNLTKEDKETSENFIKDGHFLIYANAETNRLFKMFLAGIDYGKFVW